MSVSIGNAQHRGVGFQAQITLKVGQPINQVGVQTNLFYSLNFAQIATGFKSTVFFSGLGPKCVYFENRAHVSVHAAWGKMHSVNPLFVHPLLQQIGKRNSLGYAYFWYWDTRKTSQQSGAWSLQLNRAFVYFENDLFAGQGRDRFRSGVLQMAYLDSLQMASINIKIWTGETRGARVTEQSLSNLRSYKDLSASLYGKYSNGIASLSYSRSIDQFVLGTEIGIDDERIRHFFQNKLTHDFPYFYKKNASRNRHVPMLDEFGYPYLYPSTQNLRKSRIVLQTGVGLF